jgi:hypothetical protein
LNLIILVQKQNKNHESKMDIERARRKASLSVLLSSSPPPSPPQRLGQQAATTMMMPPPPPPPSPHYQHNHRQQIQQFEHVVNDAIALAAAQLAACSCNLNYSASAVEHDIKTKFWQCVPNLILIAKLMSHTHGLCAQAAADMAAAKAAAAPEMAAAASAVMFATGGIPMGDDDDEDGDDIIDGGAAAAAMGDENTGLKSTTTSISRRRRIHRIGMTLKTEAYMLCGGNVNAAINSVRAIWGDDCNALYDSTNHKNASVSSSYIRKTMGWHLVMLAMGREENSFGHMLLRACAEFEQMAPACIQVDDGTGLSTAKLTFIADPGSRGNVDKAISALNNVSVMSQQQLQQLSESQQQHLARIGDAIKRIIIA